MRNYWLNRKNLEIKAANAFFGPNERGSINFTNLEITTTLGTTFRCCVNKDGMLQSGIIKRRDKDSLHLEEEWELVERYAERLFLATGQLKEPVYDEAIKPKVQS